MGKAPFICQSSTVLFNREKCQCGSVSVRVSVCVCVQGRMAADWIDESDCVGAWQNSGLAAVLFPTAESLPQVRQIARVKGPHRLMLIINPQWQMNGQVVSDFG